MISEPHEARRIDRQLGGRCGRQGDPGAIYPFAALDDALLDWHGLAFGSWLAVRGGEVTIRVLARLAQRRAERLHARMRAALLRSDEFLGDAIAFAGNPE